jgi:hypothetical protein
MSEVFRASAFGRNSPFVIRISSFIHTPDLPKSTNMNFNILNSIALRL